MPELGLMRFVGEMFASRRRLRPDIGSEGKRRPRIGVAGSFGRGNYGDELFVKNYQFWFGHWADVYMLTQLTKSRVSTLIAESIVDQMDAVVLGGGDLICPSKSKIDGDFINPLYLRKPMHVAGVGVERNKPDMVPEVVSRWAKFLRHPNIRSISTRDAGSASWLETHVNPKVPITSHPDLACALPLPPAAKPPGAPIVGLVTRHIKNPKEYRLLEVVAADLRSKGWRIRHVIGGIGKHGAKDMENARHLQVDGKETFLSQNLDDISRALGECSLVLSMKLHTTLVATMYGVPTVCVNPVVKAREFMKSVDRDELVIGPTDKRLIDIIARGVPAPDAAKVKALRADATDYMGKLGQRIWRDFAMNDRNSAPET